MRRFAVTTALLGVLAVTGSFAQTRESSGSHRSLISASTNIIAASGSFPSMDASETPTCSFGATVTANAGGGGLSFTVKLQGSADNAQWYDVTGSSAPLGSGTGSVSFVGVASVGYRYVRVAWAWGTVPVTTGTGFSTLACKR